MFERIRFLTSDRYNRVGLSNGLASGGIVVRRLLGLPVDGRYFFRRNRAIGQNGCFREAGHQENE
ncbi:hypothetical protein LCGC14_2580400 [marine sediment metagenome]|uniref:Uncharacterized protein n=1 Tax=marine sediment metagenome TaxID=412755 RepID=A0A0F9D7C2_9ZZZZ